MKTPFACKSLFAALLMLGLAGCHTMSGLGQDIESAGDSIQDTAHDCSDNVEGNC